MQTLEKTESICPSCFKEGKLQKIDASIVEDDEKVWIIKVCKQHGSFKEIYFSDVNLYKRWIKFKVTGKPVSYVKTSLFNDSELYAEHLSQTVLTNLMVTNRSNQKYSNLDPASYIYEPSLDQLRELMRQTRAKKPVSSKAIQITGGEPTLRDDLLEIIHMAKEVGFSHVQIHTNGLKLSSSLEYCQSLKNEKVDTIYLNFDGITKTTNPLIESIKKVIENCKKVNLNIVLVPVLIKGKNLHEAGKIVRFAIDNRDIIRGVHFQQFSFFDRTIKVIDIERENQRIDYVEILQCIEQEYPGLISREDFYPIPFVFPISKLVEIITRDPQTELTAHPACGGSTFLFIIDGQPQPITRFIDVESYIKFLIAQNKKKGPLRKLRIASAFMKYVDTFVDFKKAPHGFKPKQILKDATIMGSEYALREFRHKTLFIGFMGFQDAWNIDIDRLKRCVIHYSTFEGIVPFCSYHALGYGEKILEKYSIPIQEWEKKTNHSLKDDLRQNR
jgi:7,8-dihydro-6-hydroxymethylpterin dimethyltransferase